MDESIQPKQKKRRRLSGTVPRFDLSLAKLRVEENPSILRIDQDKYLICIPCNKTVASKKHGVTKHFATAMHRTSAEAMTKFPNNPEEQAPVKEESVLDVVQSFTPAKEEFFMDVVQSFAVAGIPLENMSKFKNLFKKWVPVVGGTLPDSDSCHKYYLKKIMDAHKHALLKKLEGVHGFSVIADATNDKRMEESVNFLIATCKPTYERPFLADIFFVKESELEVDNLDSEALAKFVDLLLEEYSLPPQYFTSFVTDGAAHNLAAYDILTKKYPALLHVWCFCNMLESVGYTIQHNDLFAPEEKMLKAINKIFSKLPASRNRWLLHLQANGIETPQITSFEKTRWTSWLQSVFDTLQYFQYLPSFIHNEFIVSQQSGQPSKSILYLQELFVQNKFVVHVKLAFLQDQFMALTKCINKLQSHEPLSHKVVGYISVLHASFFGGFSNPEKYGELVTMAFANQSLSQEDIINWNNFFKKAFELALNKLDNCVKNQRSFNFFKAAVVFDPYQARSASNNWSSYAAHIPFATDLAVKEEFIQYLAWVRTPGNLGQREQFDILSFWEIQSEFWPQLAKVAICALSVPVCSADAERSFSVYNSVIDEKKNSCNDSVRVQVMLHYNGDVEGRLSGSYK